MKQLVQDAIDRQHISGLVNSLMFPAQDFPVTLDCNSPCCGCCLCRTANIACHAYLTTRHCCVCPVVLLQMSFAVSGVSLCLTLLHQLLYCLPNWQELVAGPFAASGLSIRSVVLTHTVYGLITAVHQYVQVRLLSTHGAMTVGLVNAVRASVVSVVSSWLFCAVKPQLCLTYWRGISALVVTLGAMQWVFAGERCHSYLTETWIGFLLAFVFLS